MNIPTIREQIIASYKPQFQLEFAMCLLPVLAFTCWLYYAVAVT